MFSKASAVDFLYVGKGPIGNKRHPALDIQKSNIDTATYKCCLFTFTLYSKTFDAFSTDQF